MYIDPRERLQVPYDISFPSIPPVVTKLGACKQDMAVSIAQIVRNFGHELRSWNQKLANSIVPDLQC
jgi:hypothetical protein